MKYQLLDIQVLQEDIEGFIRSLRKLPKEVHSLPVAFFLEDRMKEFKDSLPLLVDLKDEALRERKAPEGGDTAPESFGSTLRVLLQQAQN
ncbi:hypothetical protein COCON_G00073000 [Conger conger]|uniref:Dynein heavy chain linker domain-containing protein n=1 Tax=Conger conger TaxID=82655 RepID=A0A9Q1DMZ5_CONCO|nr:hypothetical protein COCON_G00073000 [Conger conger]